MSNRMSHSIQGHDIHVTLEGHEMPGSPRLQSPWAKEHGYISERERHISTIASLQEELQHAHFEVAKGAVLLREKDAAMALAIQKVKQEEGLAKRTEANRMTMTLQRQLQEQRKAHEALASVAEENRQARYSLERQVAELLEGSRLSSLAHAAETQSIRQRHQELQAEVSRLTRGLIQVWGCERHSSEGLERQINALAKAQQYDHATHTSMSGHPKTDHQLASISPKGDITSSAAQHLNEPVAVRKESPNTVGAQEWEQLQIQMANMSHQLAAVQAVAQREEALRIEETRKTEALRESLKSSEELAKAHAAEVMDLRHRLESQSQEFRSEADRSRIAISNLEQELLKMAEAHEAQTSALHHKTTRLIMSSIRAPIMEGDGSDSGLRDKVLTLLSQLYTDEIGEEQAAEQLAALMAMNTLPGGSDSVQIDSGSVLRESLGDLTRKEGKTAVISDKSVRATAMSSDTVKMQPEEGQTLPISSAPSSGLFGLHTGFVLTDPGKLMRLISRASEVRNRQKPADPLSGAAFTAPPGMSRDTSAAIPHHSPPGSIFSSLWTGSVGSGTSASSEVTPSSDDLAQKGGASATSFYSIHDIMGVSGSQEATTKQHRPGLTENGNFAPPSISGSRGTAAHAVGMSSGRDGNFLTSLTGQLGEGIAGLAGRAFSGIVDTTASGSGFLHPQSGPSTAAPSRRIISNQAHDEVFPSSNIVISRRSIDKGSFSA